MFYLKKTININYLHVIQEVYVNSNFQCKNCTSCRKETKHYGSLRLARSAALSATLTNYHCDKQYSLRLSSADLFPFFSPAHKPAKLSPDLHFPTKHTNLKINIFIAESCNYRFRSKVIIGWVTVSGVIAVIDFAGAVAFGVDYYRVQVTLPEYRDTTLTALQDARNKKIRFRLLKWRIVYSPLCRERLWEQGSF